MGTIGCIAGILQQRKSLCLPLASWNPHVDKRTEAALDIGTAVIGFDQLVIGARQSSRGAFEPAPLAFIMIITLSPVDAGGGESERRTGSKNECEKEIIDQASSALWRHAS
jgi:hypothetical protein